MTPPRTARARSLRRFETEAEQKLWLRLRDRRLAGHKFVRQCPVGPFFGDFVCRDAKLIVELDGSQHAENVRDVARDLFLNGQGYAVLRFWNNEVFAAPDAICETILAAIERRLAPFERYSLPSSALSGTFSPAGRREPARRGTDQAEPCPPPHWGGGARRADEGPLSTARSPNLSVTS